MDIFDGSTFNIKEYIVDKKRIGKGSFSTIYKCRHNLTNKQYALKEITIDKNKNKNKMNIKREFEIMRKLNHENIVKIHDVIIDTRLNNIYFIMDYYEYGDLSQFLNKKPLKEKFTRKYMKQLSNGLKYLLDNNILHRDLKPQNILLSKNFDIKLTDFGFATYYTKDTIINTLCGSPMYMAPEIITKNGYNYNSDLWSVGIILYEMIHGYTPFNVSNFIDLIKEIKKKNIQIKMDVSEECKELIYSLCKINPNERLSWNDFFNHNWFTNNEILEDENNLMNINFEQSLPNINNYTINDKQFCSFTHTSISESEPLEFKFLHDVDDDDYNDVDDDDDDSTSDDYVSADETNDNDNDSKQLKYLENESYVDVKPINIPTKYNDFILINPNDHNAISLPNNLSKKTLTDSFREYLYSSIKLIKYSYDYISNNSI
jgi:serine/threonine protein kinase